MANVYVKASFSFRAEPDEMALFKECLDLADWLGQIGDDDRLPDLSDAFKAAFPPEEDNVLASFLKLLDDPDNPSFGADYAAYGKPGDLIGNPPVRAVWRARG